MIVKKYVIIAGQPVLFPAEIQHADIVGKIGKVEGAGFFTIAKSREEHNLKVTCFGESFSLAINSRPEIDKKIIVDFLKLEQSDS